MIRTVRGIVVGKLTAVSFVAFFAVISLWSGAVPMFGSPDETAHMVRAAGIVRGQVDGTLGAGNLIEYDVPAILLPSPPCYAFDPAQTADCLIFSSDSGDAMVASTASTYPPALHIISGIPTLFSSGLRSLYLMRLANGLVCAGLLTLALSNCSLLDRQRTVAAVLPLAVTPMVLFLSGTVNPTGISTAAGLAVWTSAFVLADPETRRSANRAAAAFGIPLCLLILTRRDSLLWSSAIIAVLVVLIPFDQIISLFRRRSIQVWATIAAATALAHFLLWTNSNADGFSSPATPNSDGGAGAAFGLGFHYFREAIGVFGWLDTFMPSIVHMMWWGGLTGLAFFALATAKWRPVAALILTVGLVLAITTLIGSIRHPYFQGRYYLPLAVGAPLIAAKGIAEAGIERLRPRLVVTGYGIIFVLHQVAFAQQLRRYTVGNYGTWNFIFTHQWEPPTAPIWLLMLAYLFASAAMLAVIGTVALQRNDFVAETRPTPGL